MEGPTIDEYYSGGSGSTLKPQDIVDDDMVVTIKSFRGKTWDDGSKSLYLQLDGVDKDFRVNATNARRIAEMYGKSLQGWVGKPLTLFVDKVNSPQGGLVDSIIVKVKRTNRNAPKKQAFDERNPPPPLDDEVPF